MKYGKEKNKQAYKACCTVTDEPCGLLWGKVINQCCPSRNSPFSELSSTSVTSCLDSLGSTSENHQLGDMG